MYTGIIFAIVLTICLVPALSAWCERPINCPCGGTRRAIYYTHCVNETMEGDLTCERWANCQTCESNNTICLTCAPERSGPTCDTVIANKKSCPDPGLPVIGNMENAEKADDSSTRNYQEGESIHFTCDSDSVLEGPPVITCISDGVWSDPMPRCVRAITETCSDPGLPDGGNRENADGADDSYPRSFEENESVYFSCDEGDILVGPSVITCTSEGTWSDSLPRCEKKNKEKQENGKSCKYPGVIANGMVEGIEFTDSFKEQMVPSTTRLKYKCKEGYKLEGDSVLSCLCSGEWTSDPPICVAEDTYLESSSSVHCDSRGPISNGQVVKYRVLDRPIPSYEAYGELFPAGTSLYYNCNKGYILLGAKTVVCKSSGSWSAKEPKCVNDPSTASRNDNTSKYPAPDDENINKDPATNDDNLRNNPAPDYDFQSKNSVLNYINLKKILKGIIDNPIKNYSPNVDDLIKNVFLAAKRDKIDHEKQNTGSSNNLTFNIFFF